MGFGGGGSGQERGKGGDERGGRIWRLAWPNLFPAFFLQFYWTLFYEWPIFQLKTNPFTSDVLALGVPKTPESEYFDLSSQVGWAFSPNAVIIHEKECELIYLLFNKALLRRGNISKANIQMCLNNSWISLLTVTRLPKSHPDGKTECLAENIQWAGAHMDNNISIIQSMKVQWIPTRGNAYLEK